MKSIKQATVLWALEEKQLLLQLFVKVGPQRASGIRVVSMRLGCCFDPRRAEWEFEA